MRASRDRDEEHARLDAAIDTVLGTTAGPSPIASVAATAEPLELDRSDVGTPVGDLGTTALLELDRLGVGTPVGDLGAEGVTSEGNTSEGTGPLGSSSEGVSPG